MDGVRGTVVLGMEKCSGSLPGLGYEFRLLALPFGPRMLPVRPKRLKRVVSCLTRGRRTGLRVYRYLVVG